MRLCLCSHAGSAYELKDGRRVPFSILGTLCTNTSVPYNPAAGFPFHMPPSTAGQHTEGTWPDGMAFPFGASSPAAAAVDCPQNAHFMAMCAKLIYEDKCIVKDVITHK